MTKFDFRNTTEEENELFDKYLERHSTPTGFNIFDIINDNDNEHRENAQKEMIKRNGK